MTDPPSPRRHLRVELFLIRPTKYDDDGYVLRHLRAVLPSNTLACLHALTSEVQRRGALGPVSLRIHAYDESVERIPERRIIRLAARRDTRVVMCLAGVQTSQFPRACDLAFRYRTHGVTVLMGGFHVSGSLAMSADSPPDLDALVRAGVTLVAGEIDERWTAILRAAVEDRLAPIYDLIPNKPDLRTAVVPRLGTRALKRFVYRRFATLDTGRGCPFACSFCTIINVQGRAMRTREPAAIASAIKENHRVSGTTRYFFTDDNFARNPEWEDILNQLVRLRESDAIPLRFLMQVDLPAFRIPGFVDLARRAGCFQVFLGMESLNTENLAAAGKVQNKVAEYIRVIGAWREAGILTHVGYIIGFPHDDPTSVQRDLRALREDVRPDLASFFMLTPLPGSGDHVRMVHDGVEIDEDLNRFDTFHPVVDHPRMTRAEWSRLYRDAWRDFYTDTYMAARMTSAPAHHRITLLQMYLWYTAATAIEGFHPMMTGFFRLKPRRDRRPGHAVDGRLGHLRHRVPEITTTLREYARLVRRLKRVWSGVPDHASVVAPLDWMRFLGEMFGAA